jgi:hypothetical protein
LILAVANCRQLNSKEFFKPTNTISITTLYSKGGKNSLEFNSLQFEQKKSIRDCAQTHRVKNRKRGRK